MSQPKKMPIAEVEWTDARAIGGWRSAEEYEQDATLMPCRSVGYLLKKDEQRIILVQSRNQNGSLADSITIPRRWIEKIRIIEK